MFKGSFLSELSSEDSSDSDNSSESENQSNSFVTLIKPSVTDVIDSIEKDKKQHHLDSNNFTATSASGWDLSGKDCNRRDFENSRHQTQTSTTTVLQQDVYKALSESSSQSTRSDISERSVKAAIKKGDIEKAVELSDLLAIEEASSKRLQEVEAKKFVEKIDRDNKRKIAKKRKKLNWTFEAKKRWETKSNM